MFSIDKDTKAITMIKKDTASIDFALDNYSFVDGDKATFTVAKELEQETPVIQVIATQFDNEGIAHFDISSEQSNIDEGTYLYDVQVDLADGRVDTVIGPAKFKIKGGVTF